MRPLVRNLTFIFILTFLALGGWGGLVAFKAYKAEKSLHAANLAFDKAQYTEALNIIDHYYNPASASSLNPAWETLKINSLLHLNQGTALAALYNVAPERFNDNEAAVRLVIASLYQLGENNTAVALREAWRGKETDAALWLFLDVESALFLNQIAEARTLLSSTRFTGEDEALRLLQLSYLEKDPVIILSLLDEALVADPQSPEVRLARGQIFEKSNQPRLASFEYASAITAAPKKAVYYHTLGDFYYRIGQRPLAITVWADGAGHTQDAALWLKAYTWGRLIKTTPLAPLPTSTQEDPLQHIWPLLANTPAEAFLPLSALKDSPVLTESPELAFLGALEALRLNDLSTAASLLQSPALTTHPSIAPIPQATLNGYVGLKLGQTFPLARQLYPFKDIIDHTPHLPSTLKGFLTLSNAYAQTKGEASPSFTPEAAKFFTSEACLPSLIALADLPAAAIRLNPWVAFSPSMHTEATYAYAQALKAEAGPAAAWAFIPENGTTPSLGIFRAQCGLADASTRKAALAFLSKLTTHPLVGTQASYLQVTAALEDKDPITAEAILLATPTLSASLEGQLAFAECALLQNNPDLAESRYLPLVNSSPQAAEFLCLRAAEKADWPQVVHYLQMLVNVYPDRSDYRVALAEALKKATPISTTPA